MIEAEVMGARLMVRVLTMELKTAGGIIMPRAELPGAPGDAKEAMAQMGGPPTLQLADILKVGEGQWNQERGEYRGSRFKVGQRVLFRCGPGSQVHMDGVPIACGGKADEMLIQESQVAMVIKGKIHEVAA